MRKVISISLITLVIIMCAIPWILLLNSKYEFLPEKISIAVDNFINNSDKTSSVNAPEYVLLSTISDSPVLKKVDWMVPQETYIPSKEEIEKNYSGLYSDSIVATLTNYDIIIQNYGIDITENMNLNDFKDEIVHSLQKNCPYILFEADRLIKKGDTIIPIIEFSTQRDDRITYSFIALVDIHGEFLTITVNSADPYLNAVQFFNALIHNMAIK